MKKLWEKDYKLDHAVEKYCSGNNVVLDNELARYDVLGTLAHAKMLQKIGILTKEEFRKTKSALVGMLALIDKKVFKVELGDEDVHTKVENVLIEELGDTGKKIHTARSRNDQINLDIKLFSKDSLLILAQQVAELVTSFQGLAIKYEFVPMPGYTHMQKAMPSSVGMWAGSFAESLIDDLSILKSAFDDADQSPLGSGAAYGVSLEIDREYTSKLLGFGKVQNNSLYAQVSRVKSQGVTLHALSQIMLTLSRFASDMLIFTTSEFDYFNVPSELCTGSSIMPQKNNLDIMEILRARTHRILQYAHANSAILAGLPSGYNADFAETKESLLVSFSIVKSSVRISNLLVGGISPKKDNLKNGFSKEIYATHAAYQLVKKGIPFREAYKQVALSLEKIPEFDSVEVIKASVHSGSTGKLNLKNIGNDLKKEMIFWKQKEKEFNLAINSLTKSVTQSPVLSDHSPLLF